MELVLEEELWAKIELELARVLVDGRAEDEDSPLQVPNPG